MDAKLPQSPIVPVRGDAQKPSLISRVFTKLFGNPIVRHFTAAEQKEKGRGFSVGGKEFVHHTELHHHETAFVNIIGKQKIVLFGAIALVVLALFLNWHLTVLTIFAALTILYFIDLLFNAYLIYNSFAHTPEIQVSQMEMDAMPVRSWPKYTIFCPLYKEWQVVPQFVEAMEAMDYPKDKLQVMFLLEEDDTQTVDKIRAYDLPAHYTIVVVPHSKPKTKPKAMNYGLNFVTGEYITIYDAEDVPDPLQLKKAVIAFTKAPATTVCIQAKLNFYNPHQNLLTRIFTAEYSLWFDLVLPGLQSVQAPIPLGGTSNHFKAEQLKELSGWDAFNVTEDCDLGMRLVKRGYTTAIVDSTTMEEANSDWVNWYKQRSRWIKGYIQTYLVHMRNPSDFWQQGKRRNLFVFQLTVGGKILSMFINPFLWVVTICYFLFRAKVGLFIESFFPDPILYIGVFSLVMGNFLYLYYYMIGCARRGLFSLMKYVFVVPFYWLYMSAAAWQAVYEIIVKPHYWAKTVHGLHLSKDTMEQAAAAETGTEVEVGEKGSSSPVRATPLPARMNMSEITLSSPVTKKGTPHVVVAEVPKPVQASLVEQVVAHDAGLVEPAWYSFASIQKLARGKTFSGGGPLVMAMLAANFLNFLFNAILGRTLTLEDFGTVTLFNTVLNIMALGLGALGSSVNFKTAYLVGQNKAVYSMRFLNRVLKGVWGVTAVLSVVWIVLIPFFSTFFNVSHQVLVLSFTPVLTFGSIAAVQNGYLRGRFQFALIGKAIVYEALSKTLLALAIASVGFREWTTVSIPLSIMVSYIVTQIFVWRVNRQNASGPVPALRRLGEGGVEPAASESTSFPIWYFGAAVMSGVAGAAFLNVDVLLAKHFLNPSAAGAYSLLSLIGKMVFLLGSLLSAFIVSIVSKHEGAGTNAQRDFYRLFSGTVFMSLAAFVGVGVLGKYTVPLLFGSGSLSIVQYLLPYCFAMVLFTLSSTVVSYHMAKKQYSFAWIMLASAGFLVVGIARAHDSIAGFTHAMLTASVVSFVAIFAWHAIQKNATFVLRNITDFLEVFMPLKGMEYAGPGKKILVFNWRDNKHAYAGGAEVYVHELARRWVETGNHVTLFCGNDGHAPRTEVIDGVHVVRRGGFYFVYIWAFVYYLIQFRGRFDVILDCQNGIPFFTPLYAREPVYCLLHHVHQEVFRKYLNPVLAFIASTLESKVMPWAYKDCKFITISNSSRKEMEDLELGLAGIEIVHPGVDLSSLEPGNKHENPLVLYLGRLKAYKSVDVLIQAFRSVAASMPHARLVIAGDGEERGVLEELVRDVNLTEKITFTGKSTEAEKVALLQQSWVFVNPSMMEGWGITSIEANACGVPVVAADVPGLRDSVKNPHTGYLVEHGNVEKFAEKIELILKDKSLQKTMEKESLLWAQNFDWDKSATKSLRILYGK